MIWNKKKTFSSMLLFCIAWALGVRCDVLLYASPLMLQGFGTPMYGTIFLSLSEILVLLLSSHAFWTNKVKMLSKKEYIFWGVLTASILFSSLSAVDPILAILSSRYIIYIFLLRHLLFSKKDVHACLYGLISVALLHICTAAYQVWSGHALGLYFLGEPHLSVWDPHFAKYIFHNMTYIRGYGLFDHPNILGAFLVGIVYLLHIGSSFPKKLLVSIHALLVVGILLTGSKIALFSCIFLFFYQQHNKRSPHIWWVALPLMLILVLFSVITQDSSFSERLFGMYAAIQSILQHPLGIGFSHFPNSLLSTLTPLAPWLAQPVHNTFLLFLAEAGIVTSILVGFGWYNIRRTFPFVLMTLCIFLGMSDHALLTAPPLLFLFVILYHLTKN